MRSKFVSESQDLKAFNDNIAKSNGLHQKFEATNIGPNDISIQDIDQEIGREDLARQYLAAHW